MNFDIRFVNENEIEKAKSLFCLCFGSELAEADIFFRPKQKKIVGAYSGDTLCSMMTIFECEAVLEAKTISAGYIAGVATSPEYRGNKLFKRCYDFFFQTNHGYKMLFCIPATTSLFEFYIDAGLNKTTFVKQAYFIGSGENSNFNNETTALQNDERKLVIKKHPELAAAAAEAFVYYGGKIINGEDFIAFVYENEKEVTIADICTNNYDAAIPKILDRIESSRNVRVVLPNNFYTKGIEGETTPIAVYTISKESEDKLMLDGLYINMLFNDI